MKTKQSNQKRAPDSQLSEKKPSVKKSRTTLNSDTIFPMQIITTTPGLQHIAEGIFANLKHRTVMKCKTINKNLERILETPLFLYKACVQKDLITLEQQQKWSKIIQGSNNNSIISEQLVTTLTKIHSEQKYGNIYHNKLFSNYSYGPFSCPFLKLYANAICEGDSEIVQILAPAMDNPNAAGLFTYSHRNTVLFEKLTPIRLAVQGGNACSNNYNGYSQTIYEKHCIIPISYINGWNGSGIKAGHLSIVKIIASLTKTPITDDNVSNSSPWSNDKGGTPIHIAAKRKDGLNMVKVLASLTENPLTPNEYGASPIHDAALYGNLDILKFLSSLTDNPNAPDKNGATPIHNAATEGHLNIVEYLSTLTDNPNVTTIGGETPIHKAAQKGNSKIVEFLSGFTKNPNTISNSGQTPIHNAAECAELNIVKFLSGFTENPITLDNAGRTPILMAASNPNCSSRDKMDVIRFLSGFTENPNAPDNSGQTPILMAASKKCFDKDLDIIKFLTSFTDNPNVPDNEGETAMHKAAYHGNVDIAKFLVDFTTSPNAKNNKGETPIQIARRRKQIEFQKFLSDHVKNAGKSGSRGKKIRS